MQLPLLSRRCQEVVCRGLLARISSSTYVSLHTITHTTIVPSPSTQSVKDNPFPTLSQTCCINQAQGGHIEPRLLALSSTNAVEAAQKERDDAAFSPGLEEE